MPDLPEGSIWDPLDSEDDAAVYFRTTIHLLQAALRGTVTVPTATDGATNLLKKVRKTHHFAEKVAK